jgi:hypothetical protein
VDADSNDPVEQAIIRLGDTVERNIDRAARSAAQVDRTLISLSAGAILLSSTFVPIFAPLKLWLLLLFLAWLSFLITMVVVIFAMRSAQLATEAAIRNASDALRKFEENPATAREAIKVIGLQQPIVKKLVRRNKSAELLNNCALIAFVIGVVCLATFAGYNLWRTPTVRPQHETSRMPIAPTH